MIADCGKNSIMQYNIAQHAIKKLDALHRVSDLRVHLCVTGV